MRRPGLGRHLSRVTACILLFFSVLIVLWKLDWNGEIPPSSTQYLNVETCANFEAPKRRAVIFTHDFYRPLRTTTWQESLTLLRAFHGDSIDIVLVTLPADQRKLEIPSSVLETLLRYTVKIVEFPLPKMSPTILHYMRENRNCCEEREYLKLSAFRLLEYDAVLLLDTDVRSLVPLDLVFKCAYGLSAFISTPGPWSPLNGGFWALQPNMTTFQLLEDQLLHAEYNNTHGWNGTGFGREHSIGTPSYGAEGPQGFLFWLFYTAANTKIGLPRAYQLNQCVWNCQCGLNCHRMCNHTDVNQINVVHKCDLKERYATALESARARFRPAEQLEYRARRLLRSSEDNLFFLHIPKTAGSSFTSILRRYLGCDPRPCVVSPRPSPCPRLINCYGHNVTTDRPYRHAVTLLRNPLDRVISAYNHARRERIQGTRHCCGVHPQILSRVTEMDLYEFANHPCVRNQQTKMLAGLAASQAIDSSSLSLSNLTEELLRRAKRRLDEMTFVGLTEEWNRSVMLFTYTFGGPLSAEDLSIRTRVAPPESNSSVWMTLTPQQQRRIIRSQALDFEVYEYAKDLFESRWRSALLASMQARKLFDLSAQVQHQPHGDDL